MELEAALDQQVGPEPAVGDLFTATVVRGPIGGHVTGRLTRLQRAGGSWVIGMMLLKVEWPGNVATPAARLKRGPEKVKGEAVLPKGLHLTWRME
jgi:hypothetical protein